MRSLRQLTVIGVLVAVLVAVIAPVLLLIRGVEKQRAAFGTVAIPAGTCYSYALYLRSYEGPLRSGTKQPRCVVLWKSPDIDSAPVVTISSTLVPLLQRFGRSSDVVSIDGHLLSLSVAGPSVYALQPDYSMRQIPLSKDDVDRVLNLVTDNIGAVDLGKDSFWQTRVDPYLPLIKRANPAQGLPRAREADDLDPSLLLRQPPSDR